MCWCLGRADGLVAGTEWGSKGHPSPNKLEAPTKNPREPHHSPVGTGNRALLQGCPKAHRSRQNCLQSTEAETLPAKRTRCPKLPGAENHGSARTGSQLWLQNRSRLLPSSQALCMEAPGGWVSSEPKPQKTLESDRALVHPTDKPVLAGLAQRQPHLPGHQLAGRMDGRGASWGFQKDRECMALRTHKYPPGRTLLSRAAPQGGGPARAGREVGARGGHAWGQRRPTAGLTSSPPEAGRGPAGMRATTRDGPTRQ